MAPEYGMEGLFSVKSDVYSFGILVLEIVSGRRNNSFRCMGNSIINIVGYVSKNFFFIQLFQDSKVRGLISIDDCQAWQLWNEDRAMEFVDSSIVESCSTRQAMRCIHVGLLCVDDRASDRPDMPAVLLMLGSTMGGLPMPKQPTYISQRDQLDTKENGGESYSANDMTITVVTGR